MARSAGIFFADQTGIRSRKEASTEEEGEGQPGEPKDLDREEAERLLQLASDQEKKTQEKIRLGEKTRQRPEKDW